MNLIIDLGNTRVKFGLFKQNELIQRYFSTNLEAFDWQLIDKYNIDRIMCASVRDEQFIFPDSIAKKLIYYTSDLNFPVKIDYKTPETLGSDRIANAVAANFIFPNKNVLVIDVGTCLKTDMVLSSNTYIGGSISPGLSMRCVSLNEYTGKLPLIKPQAITSLNGKSTFESLNSGVVNGMNAEINWFIKQYSEEFDDLKVVATGGDIDFFVEAIKSPIFAHDFLTLFGLNLILQYN